jgi:hypothetical protein
MRIVPPASLALALTLLAPACQRSDTATPPSASRITAIPSPTSTTPSLELDLTVDDATRHAIDLALGRDPSTHGARAGAEPACPAVDQSAVASIAALDAPVHVELSYDGEISLLRCRWTGEARSVVLSTRYEVDDWSALQMLAAEQYQRRVDVGVASGLTITGDVVGVLPGGVWYRWTGPDLTDDQRLALAAATARSLSSG